jgi:hypothetical protein
MQKEMTDARGRIVLTQREDSDAVIRLHRKPTNSKAELGANMHPKGRMNAAYDAEAKDKEKRGIKCMRI